MKIPAYQHYLIYFVCLVSLSTCTPDSVDNAKQKCLIVKQTFRNSTASSGDQEITIDGKKYTVGVTSDYTYKYDDEGRLIQMDSYQSNYTPPNASYKYSYPHLDTLLTLGPFNSKAVLNTQGAVVKEIGSTNQYTYDSEGFQTKLVISGFTIIREVVNGNIVTEEVYYNGKDRSVFTYEYDLTKQNLPAISTHYGTQSRNLLIKEKRDDFDSTGKPYPGSYIINYQYEYDQQGRITRKYYLDPTQPTLINLVDYQYQCQ